MKSKDSKVVSPFSLNFMLELTEMSVSCGWKKWFPNMEGTCSYGEMAREGPPAKGLDWV
jgi:hypothetical protein